MDKYDKILWSSTDDLATEQGLEFLAAYRSGIFNAWADEQAREFLAAYYWARKEVATASEWLGKARSPQLENVPLGARHGPRRHFHLQRRGHVLLEGIATHRRVG